MLHLLKKTFGLIALSGILCCIPVAGLAQTEEPVIVLKSSIYETYGESNSFQILIGGIEGGDYIDIDCGFGTEEHELEQATYDSSTGSWSGTLITCNVSKEGVVKIYGNAGNIDVFNASGCYLRSADFSSLTNLEILDLSHNELEALDLTNFTKLQALYLDDNPFNVKPLIVGGNKPELMILEMGQIERLDASFNLSDYPELTSFNAWANKGLTKLDPTGCPKLVKISIDSTPVSELNVTKNPLLQILNISDTGIKSIDLSQNTNLTQFFCDHLSGTLNTDTKLTSLDVTQNPNLIYLYASGNSLTDIDVSQNRYLRDLFVDKNKLTNINLDNNPNLVQVSLRYNYFTFATLPMPGIWNTYNYVQNTMSVARTYKVGDVIDLSDKVLREGTTTTAALYMTSESKPGVLTPLGEEYFNYDNGKITLLKAVSDSVYVAFANDAFPESALSFYPLCTNRFMVKTAENYGQDDKAFSFVAIAQSGGTPVSFKLGLDGATKDNPKKFYVDYGDGTKTEYSASSSSTPAEPNAVGISATGRVTVYVPEGELVTALDMENIALASIDVSALHALGTLRLAGTELYTNGIDLGWNCSLTRLELTGNHFSTLNIRGANDAYQKNFLHDINLSNNELTSVTLNDNYTIHNLNLSHNQLTELSFKDADLLETLDVSNNRLTSIDLNYCTLMTSLNIADNNISSITLPAEISLTSLHCENNNLNFNTIPSLAGLDEFVYAPQNDLPIPTKGPGVDLSEQNLNGNTVYVWKKADDGTVISEVTDYTEENGKTRFLSSLIGTKVYCEMTNPSFDGLILKTSSIEVAGMPTNVVATFTTTSDQTATLTLVASEPNTSVYIDWKGDAVELEQYSVGTSPNTFTVTTHKNAAVKVYSYDENSNLTVFTILGASMSSMDVSNLKQLGCLNVKDAGLSSIKMPESDNLSEIYLDGNNFSEIDLRRYTGLKSLSLNNNKFTTFDASLYPNLEYLALGSNQLTSVTLDNSKIWNLSLNENNLGSIDLTKLPELYQLFLSNNELSSIDVSGLNKLAVLCIDRNKFKFSTLPANKYGTYIYTDQAELTAEVVDGKVDLSSEAVIDGSETTYRWFVDTPVYDDYGELTGEELYVDEEYTVNNGVTTFLKPIDNVMCVLTNEKFPDLVLYTSLVDIATTGIGDVTTEGNERPIVIEGNNIKISASEGVTVKLYGIDGTLISSTVVRGGECVIPNLLSGVYVVAIDNSAHKIVIR